MRVALSLTVLFLAAALAGCVSTEEPPQPASDGTPATEDAVVIAVVDSAFNPYHWDFLAAHMPQHMNHDPSDDFPLDQDPAAWLPGHPGASAFAGYGALNLTLTPDDPEANPSDLYSKDEGQWGKVARSSAEMVHLHHIPGTKVVGYVNFRGGDGFAATSHGVGTSSVSVGNIYGSCPECLLVFVNGPSEVANEWVAQQDWIDLQTNSWGLSLVMRDRMYAKSDTDLQRTAIERGQSIFFSAGNGQANTFTVPNPTLWSSQEGPDWIITVGAVSPGGQSYSGHGKPADVASVGSGYPSAGGGNVTAESTFGGTSNATPVTAGIYGRALYLLRREMAEASRVQSDGTIAAGDAGCGSANADCALADGRLSVHELREALFSAAVYTPEGWGVSIPAVPVPYETREMMYMAEGHGTFWGRMTDDWWLESERVAGYANGTWYEGQDPEQHAWFVADSYCRQSLWGTWDHGYHTAETELPPSDLADHPMRTWLRDECPERGRLVHQVVSTING